MTGDVSAPHTQVAVYGFGNKMSFCKLLNGPTAASISGFDAHLQFSHRVSELNNCHVCVLLY